MDSPRVHRVGLGQGRVAMGRRQRKSSHNGEASSVLREGRFEYGSNQSGHVQERRVYVKLYCVYLCILACGVDRDPPGKCSVI